MADDIKNWEIKEREKNAAKARLSKFFDGNDPFNEFLEFDRIKEKFSNWRDLHALILLDKLIPGNGGDIISASEHDLVWLAIDIVALNKVATDEQLIDLLRCGVFYDDDIEGLALHT